MIRVLRSSFSSRGSFFYISFSSYYKNNWGKEGYKITRILHTHSWNTSIYQDRSRIWFFCSSKGIKHIVSPVGDHRGKGSVERSMQTKNRKLGTAKLDPNFGNFKETIQEIVENIRKGKNSVLKKSPFELHFGRKPNTEWSQAYHNIV